jgi:tripartite ATP-independent transporter DctP family solute receptor
MNMRITLKSTLLACVVGGAISLSQVAMAAQNLRIASNFPAEHSVSKAMEIFKTEVEKNTTDSLKISLFPNMMLGGATENIDQTRSGTIFGTLLSVAYMSRIVPEFEAVSLPFVFNTHESAWKVADGKVGQILNDKMAAKGFKGLGFGELGFRNVTNNVRPIATLADFKDLKIRLQPNEVHINAFRALGANPVAMDISEVYSALQQGVLDGQENPYDSIATRRFNEVQKYISDSRHLFDFMVFVVNKQAFDKLSPEDQKVVSAAAKKAIQWQRNASATEADKWRDTLIKRGMQYTEVSDEARAKMREATASVVQTVRKNVGDEIVDAMFAEAGK